MRRARFVVLLASVSISAGVTGAMAGPKASCDAPVHDFGVSLKSQNVVHSFAVKNVGDAPLEIKQVTPQCGCTVAEVSQQIVAPGSTATISATLSLKGERGFVRKTIAVHTNDPSTSHLELAFAGTARALVDMSPAEVAFAPVQSDGAEVTRSVELSSNLPEPLSIIRVEAGSPAVRGEAETVKEGKAFQLRIILMPPATAGKISSSVRVLTSHPDLPALEIPVTALVMGDIAFSPMEVAIPEEVSGSLTRYIVVSPSKVKAFKILKVEAPDPAIQTRVIEMGESVYRIQVKNLRPTTEIDGKVLRITTDAPGMRELLVPVRLTRKPSTAQAAAAASTQASAPPMVERSPVRQSPP